jgi:hypothetical protein
LFDVTSMTQQIKIHQPKLLKNLKENVKDLIEENARVFKTPLAPKTLIINCKGDPLILPEQRKQFRMDVGILFYLVKHSCPDFSKSVRELLKVADGAAEGHFKALLRIFKYVLGSEDHGLLVQPKFNNDGFYLEGLFDGQYANDLDT